MSTDIVLPNLENWVQQRVTALYSAKTTEDFDSAFDVFLAKDVSITLNGKGMSRDEYKQMVQGEIKTDVGADVTFNGVVSVPTEDTSLDAIGTGTVGVFFKAVVFGRLFIFAQRESTTVSSSMNVVVIHDPTIQHVQVGRGGGFDARRVTSLVEVLTDEQNKIVPPFTPLPPTTITPTTTTPSS